MNPFDFNRYPVSDGDRHWKYARDLALCCLLPFLLLLGGIGACVGKMMGL